MKSVSSLVSVLVLAAVLFGAPIYDAVHGNWPGAGYSDALDLETIRSGGAARTLEANLERNTSLDELARPRYNEVRFLALGETHEGVVAGHDRWLFPAKRLGPVAPGMVEQMHRSVEAIGDIVRWLEARGCKVVFEFIPRKSTLFPEQLPADWEPPFEPYFDLIRDAMLAEGLDVPDLRPILGSKDPLLYFTNDSHWTPRGNHLAAGLIAERIKERCLPGPVPGTQLDVEFRWLPPDTFIGQEQKLLGFAEGSWLNGKFTNPIRQVWVVDSKDEDKFHFGSQDPEPILAVGTSMSFLTASNLIGHLGVDVENYARPGYAAGYRMVDILKGILTEQRPVPEVLVWEFPEDFPIREGRYFREPLSAIVDVMSGGPYQVTSLDSAQRTIEKLTIRSEEGGMIKGRTKGPGASIEYTLPEPIAGDAGFVFCFDMTPGGQGPPRGVLEIEWGTDPKVAPLGKRLVMVRKTNLPHSIMVPMESEPGTEIRFVRIKLYEKKTNLEIGHAELWSR